MAILLTGGAGFIGSHLAASLLAMGREVVVLDNFDAYYDPSLKRRNLAPFAGRKGFLLVEGDIRDRALLERIAIETPLEAIVHLAARAGVRASVEDPRLCAEVNVIGTVEILELARRRAVPKVIFASSSSIYGERKQAPFREEDPIDHPLSPYAATKSSGELLCSAYHQLFGFDIAILRFFTVYGPRQRPEMAIHHFARLIDEGREVPIFGDGSARRDFTYVADVVAGVTAALERSRGLRVYNLGNSRTVELREVVRLLAEALGKPAKVRSLPLQPGDVSFTCASIERAGAEIGYRPATPFAEGLSKFVEWYRADRAAARAP